MMSNERLKPLTDVNRSWSSILQTLLSTPVEVRQSVTLQPQGAVYQHSKARQLIRPTPHLDLERWTRNAILGHQTDQQRPATPMQQQHSQRCRDERWPVAQRPPMPLVNPSSR